MKQTAPIRLASAAPVADNGSKFNYAYLAVIPGSLVGFAGGPIGMIVGALLGAIVGYVIKDIIIGFKNSDLRQYEFELPIAMPYNLLCGELSQKLSQQGLFVEMNSSGQPVITFKNTLFDVYYNDNNTFTIWWRKSLGRAFIPHGKIKLYRNCVVAMGIIGYNVQQSCAAYAVKYQQSNNV